MSEHYFYSLTYVVIKNFFFFEGFMLQLATNFMMYFPLQVSYAIVNILYK